MRVDTGRLELLFKYTALIKTKKPYFDVLRMEFTKDGLWIKQTDSTKTLAVVGFFKKEFFNQYDYEGVVNIPVATTYSVLKKAMKDSAEVELVFTEDKFSIIGKTTKITDNLMTVEMPEMEGVEIKEYKNLLISKSFEPVVGYLLVDYSVLSELECDSSLEFSLSKNGLKIKCTIGTAEVERSIPTALEEYREDIKVMADIDIIEQIVKSTKTTLSMALTKPEGEPGPIILGVSSDLFKVSYWVVPKILE